MKGEPAAVKWLIAALAFLFACLLAAWWFAHLPLQGRAGLEAMSEPKDWLRK